MAWDSFCLRRDLEHLNRDQHAIISALHANSGIEKLEVEVKKVDAIFRQARADMLFAYGQGDTTGDQFETDIWWRKDDDGGGAD